LPDLKQKALPHYTGQGFPKSTFSFKLMF